MQAAALAGGLRASLAPAGRRVGQGRPASRASRPPRSSVNGAQAELQPGARVRVASPIRVYHVGKFGKEGLDLQGREGVVQGNVAEWKGQTLSANTPWKTLFMVKGPDGNDVKVIAHLAEDELEQL